MTGDGAHRAAPPDWWIESALPELAWPAVPGGSAPAVLALLFQMERAQWLAPEAIAARQHAQLELLLRHAWEHSPACREAWRGCYEPGMPAGPEVLAALPLLGRARLRDGYEDLLSRHPPAAHGEVFEMRTSGSTGSPVRVAKTALVQLFWMAITLRDHLWHRRDLSAKLACIRQGAGTGTEPNWGSATLGIARTGPCALLGVGGDIGAQWRWLQGERPAYLLTYPSIVGEMLKLPEAAAGLEGLREVRTFGELVDPGLAARVHDAWGVPLTDNYSSTETGYIALQCPEGGGYHVQAEDVLVEVLDDRGRPCAPGEIGRVVVTCLHNFALPLVRYDIGDYAEAGGPCACGRGMPGLRRVLGRQRNTLIAPDGRRYWPAFGSHALAGIAPVQQHQFVQTAPDRIEARLVLPRALTEAEASAIRASVLSRLPAGLRLDIIRVEAIPRGAGGKFEDFRSDLA